MLLHFKTSEHVKPPKYNFPLNAALIIGILSCMAKLSTFNNYCEVYLTRSVYKLINYHVIIRSSSETSIHLSDVSLFLIVHLNYKIFRFQYVSLFTESKSQK
jgi:hypothetical protein